jgi:hypothetical protein
MVSICTLGGDFCPSTTTRHWDTGVQHMGTAPGKFQNVNAVVIYTGMVCQKGNGTVDVAHALIQRYGLPITSGHKVAGSQ